MGKHKRFIIGVIGGVILLFLFFQYRTYSQIIIFENVSFAPLDGADDLSTGWRYIRVSDVDSEEFLNNVEVQTRPNFEHNVYSGIPEDIQNEIVPDLMEVLNSADLLEGEGEEYLDERLKREYTYDTVIIEREGELFEENTEYTIRFKYRDRNIITWLFPPTLTYTFTTGTSTEDELEMIKTSLGFGVSSFVLFGNKQVREEREKRDESCPFWIAETANTTSDYELLSADCDFFETGEGTGEDLKVKILNPDFEEGKEAFRKELERIGLEENEQLRVEYVR